MPDPLSPEIVLALSPAALRALVSAFSLPVPPKATPLDVARFLFDGGAPRDLARAVPFLARLSTDSGKRAILEAARAVGDARVAAWSALSAPDLAVTLAVERAGTIGKVRRVAARIGALALLRATRELAERPTYELLVSPPLDPAAAPRLVAGEFDGELHDSWAHRGADGVLRVALFHRVPGAARLVVDGDRVARRDDVAIAVDLLRVARDGSRVAITTARPELLARYAGALGASLRASLTLKPLHDLTAAKLAAVAWPRGVRGVAVIALRWRTSDGARVEVRAADALAACAAFALRRTGYVDRATLRVDLGDRTVDAFLHLPHRVEIASSLDEPPVRAALEALGLFDPGALPDDARSLAPYEHPDWRWRGVVRDAGFDLLVSRGLLARIEVAHVATEDARMHGASYVVRDVPGTAGDQYALAEDRAYGARLVSDDDRVAWRLDRDALARAMRADLGAAAPPHAIAIDGVLDAGVVTLESGRLRFVYPMATPPAGWLESARRACGIGVTLVVLAPRGHAAGMDGVLVVELDVDEQLGVKSVARALAAAAEALGVAGEIEPWRRYDEVAIVEAATQRAWIRGVLVPLSGSAYRFLEYLAKNPHVVAAKEVGPYVSAGEYPEEAARRARSELEKQAAAALARAGIDLGSERLVVTEGRKGYRLGVSVRVVQDKR